jgi:hypothetical protein
MGNHKKLLENRDIRLWHDNVARGSGVTADVYLRRLGNFCEAHELTPKQLAAMKPRKLEALLLDFVGKQQRHGKAGSYVASIIKAIRSWLSYKHRELNVKIKIKGVNSTPSLKEERVPTKNELLKIFFSWDKKTRTASALIAHAGLRIETLGNYSGTDGLKVGDLPEMLVEGGKVKFEKIPTMVVVREELSKSGLQYLTFLGEEGCGYLKEYMEERIGRGEELTRDSPIITPKRRMKPFILTTNISDAIRKAIRRAGFRWRPYVLRSYFDTQLMIAESKKLVIRDYRQFWMGHKGDMEAKYTTNKFKFPKEVIDDIREAYSRAYELLTTSTAEAPGGDKIMEEFKRQLLMVAGFGPKEIEEMDVLGMDDEEFQETIRRKLTDMMKKNGARQKVVPLNKIEKYIKEGWEFHAALPNGKAIIKLPPNLVRNAE